MSLIGFNNIPKAIKCSFYDSNTNIEKGILILINSELWKREKIINVTTLRLSLSLDY